MCFVLIVQPPRSQPPEDKVTLCGRHAGVTNSGALKVTGKGRCEKVFEAGQHIVHLVRTFVRFDFGIPVQVDRPLERGPHVKRHHRGRDRAKESLPHHQLCEVGPVRPSSTVCRGTGERSAGGRARAGCMPAVP